MTFSLVNALAELGLTAIAGLTEDELKKRYRQLALEYHPDKVRAHGGDLREATEKFQRISAAQEMVRKNLPLPSPSGARVTQGPSSATPDTPPSMSSPPAPSVSKQVPRFRPSTDGSRRPATPQQVDVLFEQAAARRKRKAEVPGQCSFCVSGKGFTCIDEETAKTLGIDWQEYAAHPDHLGTCLTCKMAQRSVLTEFQAMQKFSALNGCPESFAELRAEKRTFSINSTVYYWLPDVNARVRFELRKQFVATPTKLSPTKLSPTTLSPTKLSQEKSGGGTMGRVAEALGRAVTSAGSVANTAAKRRQSEAASEPVSKRRKTPDDSFQDLFAGTMGSAFSGFGAGSQQGPWRYRVVGDNKIGIRTEPDIKAPASSAGHIPSGSCFTVSERIKGADGRLYLKISDGRGWTYDRSAKDLSKVIAREALSLEREDVWLLTSRGKAKGFSLN